MPGKGFNPHRQPAKTAPKKWTNTPSPPKPQIYHPFRGRAYQGTPQNVGQIPGQVVTSINKATGQVVNATNKVLNNIQQGLNNPALQEDVMRMYYANQLANPGMMTNPDRYNEIYNNYTRTVQPIKPITRPFNAARTRGRKQAIAARPGQVHYSRAAAGQPQTQGVLPTLIPGTENLYEAGNGGYDSGSGYSYYTPYARYQGANIPNVTTGESPTTQTVRNIPVNTPIAQIAAPYYARWNQLLTTWRIT